MSGLVIEGLLVGVRLVQLLSVRMREALEEGALEGILEVVGLVIEWIDAIYARIRAFHYWD